MFILNESNRIKIHYRNDVFFKYALSSNDEDSSYLRNTIIERVTGIHPIESEVINPNIDASIIGKKGIVLDVHIKDESGNDYDIEMQTTLHGDEEYYRFVYYMGRLLSNQLPKGSNDQNLRPVYQIIFINEEYNMDCLINHYCMRNERGKLEHIVPYENRIFIHLPIINEIAKQKGIEGMKDFEQLCYLLANDANSDILKTKERLVKVMIEKHEKMKDDGNIVSLAEMIEIGEVRYESGLNSKFNEGMDMGIQKGMATGIAKGTRKKAMEPLNSLIHSKYQIDASEWLQSLSKDQLDEFTNHILTCDTFTDLKNSI